MAKRKKEESDLESKAPIWKDDVYDPKVTVLSRIVGLTDQELQCLDEALVKRGFTNSKETLRQLGPSAFTTLKGIFVECCPERRNSGLLLELYQKDSLGNGEKLEVKN